MNTAQQRTPVPPTPPAVRNRLQKGGKPRISRTHKGTVKHKNIRRELSAGGVAVRQERGLWLVALLKTEHRRGKVWVLPKGHVELERKERVDDAAKREVQEEVGILDLVVKQQLGTTQFVFQAEEALVKKTVHYYLMVTQQVALQPQEEEGFIDAGWFPISVAITMLEYDTDQDIVAKAQIILEGKSTRIPKKQKSRRNIRIYS